MLYQIYNIPHRKHFILACSGGVDSMAIADFYKRGNKNFSLAYFDHGTGNSTGAIPLLREWSKTNNIPLLIGKIKSIKPKEMSPEEFWRHERYSWFATLDSDIITCHHLNDVVEGYLFTTLHGNPRIMNVQSVLSNYGVNNIVYRPFLTNTKEQLRTWCITHNVKWFEDISNNNTHYPRNRIRHNIIPECLQINPGLNKVIKKKILQQNNLLIKD